MHKDRQVRKRQTLVAIFIISIMVLSTLGFVLDFTQRQNLAETYNEHKFRQTPEGWKTKLNGIQRAFLFPPSQVEDIQLPETAVQPLRNTRQVFITYEPSSLSVQAFAELQFDLERRLGEYANVYAVRGLTNPEGTSLQQVTCETATPSTPVIFFKDGEATQLTFEDNCLVIQAFTPLEAARASERVLYTILGVMT